MTILWQKEMHIHEHLELLVKKPKEKGKGKQCVFTNFSYQTKTLLLSNQINCVSNFVSDQSIQPWHNVRGESKNIEMWNGIVPSKIKQWKPRTIWAVNSLVQSSDEPKVPRPLHTDTATCGQMSPCQPMTFREHWMPIDYCNTKQTWWAVNSTRHCHNKRDVDPKYPLLYLLLLKNSLYISLRDQT